MPDPVRNTTWTALSTPTPQPPSRVGNVTKKQRKQQKEKAIGFLSCFHMGLDRFFETEVSTLVQAKQRKGVREYFPMSLQCADRMIAVNELYIRVTHHRQGVDRALINHAINQAREAK